MLSLSQAHPRQLLLFPANTCAHCLERELFCHLIGHGAALAYCGRSPGEAGGAVVCHNLGTALAGFCPLILAWMRVPGFRTRGGYHAHQMLLMGQLTENSEEARKWCVRSGPRAHLGRP